MFTVSNVRFITSNLVELGMSTSKFKVRIAYTKKGRAKITVPAHVIKALNKPDSLTIVLEDNQLKCNAKCNALEQIAQKCISHDLTNVDGNQRDLTPLLDELGKIQHITAKDKTKTPCFTRRDMQRFLVAHGMNLKLKTVERRLNALVAKGLVDKIFEGQGLATFYRVTL